jgi:hypothetical protein
MSRSRFRGIRTSFLPRFWLLTTLALAGCHSREGATCIEEGDTLMGGMSLSCCAGLTTVSCKTEGPGSGVGTIARGEPLFDCAICVRECGDGECTTGENRCNCPEDCTGSGHDAGPNCHEEGVPFEAPADVRAAGAEIPLDLQATYCCQYNQSLLWVRSGPACDAALTQVMCLSHCPNLQCETGETPCTCPWDCATADEGCFSEGMEYSPLLHHATCCPGLEPIGCDLQGSDGECGSPAMDCYRCVRHCGDGQCTTGENPCNCPADCT